MGALPKRSQIVRIVGGGGGGGGGGDGEKPGVKGGGRRERAASGTPKMALLNLLMWLNLNHYSKTKTKTEQLELLIFMDSIVQTTRDERCVPRRCKIRL